MYNKSKESIILEKIIGDLELPDSAYEKAIKRYEDLGSWFDREECKVGKYHPHFFSQGSFRLGTAIKPIHGSNTYDLDLVCKLEHGLTKDSISQADLKKIIGDELEKYRNARGIKSPLEEKHRCWRIEYQDELSFHIDIVPGIPADEQRKSSIRKSILETSSLRHNIAELSNLALSITDDRNLSYYLISKDWNISNPEGYARWFESRMLPGERSLGILVEKAQVDEIPLFKRKTTLQRVIQLLKRHRDQMFKDYDEVKPISIIITTLAAHAYNGETDLGTAVSNILRKMPNLIGTSHPKIPNPVNPQEDFADRWSMDKYKHLNLEEHFRNWLRQATVDFTNFQQEFGFDRLYENIQKSFGADLSLTGLRQSLGLPTSSSPSFPQPKIQKIIDPPKPWRQ
ncbi:nucleotidyltransferase domain-containing protein [Leptospira koniambonensis]|uniref:nucleotidyltransferase domain-containing protein n=1 Tax=Leptospira koniambonensis TaxID=2484950 RepID=UPI003EBC0A95